LYVSVDFSVGHGCEVLAPWIEFHVESLTQMVPFHCDEKTINKILQAIGTSTVGRYRNV